MKGPLQILHFEPNPKDAMLIQFTLETEGISCAVTCVKRGEHFVSALGRGGFDLALSDSPPSLAEAVAQVKTVRIQWPALPLILVSGAPGEELATACLKNGATDYVPKTSLGRLAPAVRRAMQEAEDRAERLRLEAHCIAAQKTEVVGQLASGVAHDFNNILGVIIGYSDLMKTELGVDSPAQNYVEEVRLASERAIGLTRQLLIFSRKQAVQLVVIDLNDVVKDLGKMLRRLTDEHIEMVFVPGTQDGRIKADPGHIGQVLMNLVVNARDAMPNGGKLTLAISNITVQEADRSAHHDAPLGDYVLLSVSDTGVGMSEEVKVHLFEAFFTTKPVGKGTGLGLSTCKTIIERSGGHIGVHSEVGAGTTFEIYFPRVDQPVDVIVRAVPAGPLPRGTGTLLVVEDDSSVRHLACSILQSQGYEVLPACNGQEALEVARSHTGSPIRLVVTDVVMPVMNGKIMAEWLTAIYPHIKTLFTSGYTDDTIAHHGVLDAGVQFLYKPYTPATLACKVREMLDVGNPPAQER